MKFKAFVHSAEFTNSGSVLIEAQNSNILKRLHSIKFEVPTVEEAKNFYIGKSFTVIIEENV